MRGIKRRLLVLALLGATGQQSVSMVAKWLLHDRAVWISLRRRLSTSASEPSLEFVMVSCHRLSPLHSRCR